MAMQEENPAHNWLMKYFSMDHVRAKCNVCEIKLKVFGTSEHFEKHILDEHNLVRKTVIYQGYNWKEYIWLFFYITEENNAKCLFCNTTYRVPKPSLKQLKNHLINMHIVCNTHLDTWLKNHYEFILADCLYNMDVIKCVHCTMTYRRGCPISVLVSHLSNNCNITLPPIFELRNRSLFSD